MFLRACLFVSVIACSPVKSAGTAVVDCAKADAPAIENLLVQLGVNAIVQTAHLGVPDWTALEQLAEVQGVVVGGCAFSQFAHGKASSSRIAASGPDPALVALEHLRTKYGGVVWSTEL